MQCDSDEKGQPGGPGPRGDDHAAYIITHLTCAQPPNLHLQQLNPKPPSASGAKIFNVTAGISGPDTEVLTTFFWSHTLAKVSTPGQTVLGSILKGLTLAFLFFTAMAPQGDSKSLFKLYFCGSI